MGWILVTNDDGVDSPALIPLARALADVAPVEVVVPDRERSWIGKAITRHDPVTVRRVSRGGRAVVAASGYPADCVQLGLHALFPEPPALVVSGINIGYNHGSGYIHSSGTVGAAVEAFLGSVPAVAVSAGSHSRPWDEWRSWVHTPAAAAMWERLAAISAGIVSRLMALDPPDAVVNVNLPDDAGPSTPRVVTTIARVGYERLFRPDGPDRYVHDFGGGLRWFSGLEGTDVEATSRGDVALTPVTPFGSAAFTPAFAHALVDPTG